MKILSWNVNGIKAILRKGALQRVINDYDITMLQEIRTNEIPLDIALSGSNLFPFPSKKKGYSGVLTISKIKPVSVIKGLGINEFDEEGRVITIELDDYFIINAYFPRAGDDLNRLDYKIKFDLEIEKFMLELRRRKPVILCGDLNVARDKIDSTFWDEKEPGLTSEERGWINKILSTDFVDSYRFVNGNKIEYSWKSYLEKWKAMRIDYCIVSSEIKDRIKDSKIIKIEGSDHYPVYLEIL
ncbi:exodeoxyribonuclease III [Sulfolobus acidocaldarius SUSAZ]|nr:exodeoxyribonuclease III [Sulfolobus acidocaldarius SUSAZ]